MSRNACPSISQKPRYLGAPTIHLLTFVTTLICLLCILSCRKDGDSLPNANPDFSYVNDLPTHSPEQRKRDLVDLLAEAEHDRTLTKKDVESRLGMPDSVHPTGSKQYSDKIILTGYVYDLPPGEYTLPNSQKVSFQSGGRAHFTFTFDERTTYGSDGRPIKVRDDTAPLVLIELEIADDERYPHIFRSIWSWRRGN